MGGAWAGGPEPCAPVLSPSGSVCDFRPRSLAPPRSVHASAWGDCLFRRGSGTRMLVRPTSPVPVRQQVPVSRPATGEASRNAPDPGVSPRAIPLDRPPPPHQCLGPEAPLLRRRQPKGCTPPGPVGQNGAGRAGATQNAGDSGGGYRNCSLLPGEAGEVARRIGAVTEGILRASARPRTPPPCFAKASQGPPPHKRGRRR